MQKKIIALAIAGLASTAAFAQSNVTVYGVLDIGYLDTETDGKTTTAAGTTKTSANGSSTGFDTGALQTSRLGFRGTEDLGNGLKATFQLEMGLATAAAFGTDTGADLGGNMNIRQKNIGLAGNFGSVTLGRQTVLIDRAAAFGLAGMQNNAIGSIYSNRTWDARADQLVTYASPNFGGFFAMAQYGNSESDNDATNVAGVKTAKNKLSHTQTGLVLAYANGPLTAGVAYNNEDNNNKGAIGTSRTDTERETWAAVANFDFKVAKVFGVYIDSDNDSQATTLSGLAGTKSSGTVKGWELGVHVPLGKVTLLASYFDAEADAKTRNVATGVRTVNDSTDIDGYQLGALYSLSKRTTAYGMYGSQDAKTTSSLALNRRSSDQTNFAVGIRHTF